MGASSVAVKAGDTLEGRYKIIKTVGEGGMGTVFLAEHVMIKRRVAIKILRPELATDATVVERFMNEARAAGAIGHPHIVESTDMGFTRDEVPFIVFEYLEGSLLTDEIYRVRGFPPRRALRIAAQIASALQAAHSAGIIHRDLKSDNIFLTDKEEASDHVKVLDFGISRFLEADTGEDSSGRQTLMGTPEFMAPEQIITPEKVDKRADIYALGVVLYEMLTARRPFDFEGPGRTTERLLEETDKLLHKIVTDAPPPLGRPDLPPGLEELIFDKLLAKSPDERFESMTEVQAALDAFSTVARRDTQPIPVVTADGLPRAAEPVKLPPPSKSSGAVWLIGALLIGGGGAALLAIDKPPPIEGSSTALALQAEADKVGALIESEAQSGRIRAEGVASTPMLRAAIETDANTLKNMAADKDFLFKPKPGEVLEVFQTTTEHEVSMLRLPETATALQILGPTDTRLATDGSQIIVTVGAPITTQKGEPGGVIVLSNAADLASVKDSVAKVAQNATIIGLDKPVALLGTGTATGTPVTLPIKTAHAKLSLSAVPNAGAVAKQDPTLRYARFGMWGLAGLLLVAFGVARARR